MNISTRVFAYSIILVLLATETIAACVCLSLVINGKEKNQGCVKVSEIACATFYYAKACAAYCS